MNCPNWKKPYPLYITVKNKNGKIEKIRVCQDCGYLENCHGPRKNEGWRHIILHPDYNKN
jgi:hypothetical protein